MPNYGKEDFKESNINYLNKDFASLKQSLMNYAKSYFPNSYRDFNEASPGMMLLEMNAYVGDVLSFYIDQQYREMLLPLAEERRNIINLANMFGYKVKPIVPAYVDLTFSQDLDANENPAEVDYSTGGIFPSGIQVIGSDNTIVFETLDVLDFQISQSATDTNTIANTSEAGLATSYTLHREVRAVSGKQKTSQFSIGIPEKFKRITLEDKNIIDIISCIDSNGNDWYEVDYLAQDKVPISTHYTNDPDRTDAYQNLMDSDRVDLPVPYSLEYIKTGKRFTRETNIDNTTSLVFGNGVLKDGQLVDDGFIDLEQVGIIVAGQTNDLNSAIDPLLGDEYSTLGETPNNTTLTITYRVGGGIDSNIPSADLTTISSGNVLNGSGATTADLTVVNNTPARGGKDEESVEEIREKSKAFFTTQNRCVTKEDYEARVMNIPAKYGNIAKVYVSRNVEGDTIQDTAEIDAAVTEFSSYIQANTGLNDTTLLMEAVNELSTYIQNIPIAVDTSEINTSLTNFSTYRAILEERALLTKSMAIALLNPNPEDGAGTATLEGLKNNIDIIYGLIRGSSGFDTEGLSIQTRIDNISGLLPNIPISISIGELQNKITNITNLTMAFGSTIPMEGFQERLDSITSLIPTITGDVLNLSAINIYVLAYNDNKELVGNPIIAYANSSVTDNVPQTLMSNIKNYLSNFKILTDTVQIKDGYVVNFGVFFDVVAEKYADKSKVKLLCIDKIKNYFKIEKMQFNQPIHISQIEYELMGIEGVRSLNHVTISQHKDYHPNSNGEELNFKTWNYSYSDDVDIDGIADNGISGGFQANGNSDYGYKYEFETALLNGTIRPPLPSSPTVFELKNPNENIKGKVR